MQTKSILKHKGIILLSDRLNTVLIVEGGAMRSVFSAGLLDGFLKNNFNPFDYYIGVSAGASNLAAFLAHDFGKSIHIYLNLATSSEFINFRQFFSGRHLLNLDWLCQAIFSQEYLSKNSTSYTDKSLYVCTTTVATGTAVYTRLDNENIEPLLKASMALPFLYKGFPVVNGLQMTDGGIAANLPVAEAIERGAKRIMVVRSRHPDYVKKDSLGHQFIRWRLKRYPELVNTMQHRIQQHEDTIRLINNPPHDVRIVDVYPPVTFKLGRFCQNKHKLLDGYNTGFSAANAAIKQWKLPY